MSRRNWPKTAYCRAFRAVVGDTPFKIDWKSIYRFRCARLENFVHNRMIFVGDKRPCVSPFGARGGERVAFRDVDNLGWKLAAVLNGASPALIDSYNTERVQAADENILNSARTTNFMTPKSATEAMFRNEVLCLARTHEFAPPPHQRGSSFPALRTRQPSKYNPARHRSRPEPR